MKKYIIPVEINSCSGWQEFSVEADTKEEAIQKFNKGEGEFFSEEVAVEGFDDPDITAVYEEDSAPINPAKKFDINTLVADELFQSIGTLAESTEMYDMLNKDGLLVFNIEKVKSELAKLIQG